jgi:hypothetical protein
MVSGARDDDRQRENRCKYHSDTERQRDTHRKGEGEIETEDRERLRFQEVKRQTDSDRLSERKSGRKKKERRKK